MERSTSAPRLGGEAAYTQGILSNLGNPKMLAFFASLFPQFAPATAHAFAAHVLLGMLFALLTTLWLTVCATLIARAGAPSRVPALSPIAEGAMGILLIGFAIRTATR